MRLITIANDRLTVTLSTLGAEMQSIVEADGTQRLWNGDARFWTGRAPVLFPICGGLKDDTYYLDGQAYSLPKHGFARKSEWTLEKAAADRAVFLLTAQHPGFPFRYELRASYELQGSSIRIGYTVKNLDDRAFWCSVGSHEALATTGGLEHYTVVFEQPERLARYELVGNLIKTEPEIMAEEAKELPLKTEYFAVDALVFPYLKSRSVTLKNDLNPKTVRVDYDGMDVLMFWTKPGADYFCIEPWCNAPDFMDTDQQIAHKPGCMKLEPGEQVEKVHTITFG